MMERKQRLQELWEKISELKTQYQHLGLRLIHEGQKIQDPGCLPNLVLCRRY